MLLFHEGQNFIWKKSQPHDFFFKIVPNLRVLYNCFSFVIAVERDTLFFFLSLYVSIECIMFPINDVIADLC